MVRRTTTAEAVAKIFGERVVTVIDGGGRAPQRKAWYRLAPLASLLGFEADEAECERLNRAVVPGVERYEWAALGDANERRDLYPSERSEHFFAAAPDPALTARFSSLQHLRAQAPASIPHLRLDELLTRVSAVEPVFLRLASWGNEEAALRGCGPFLARFLGVEVDVSFLPLAPGQPAFFEIDAALRAHGLTLWRLASQQHATEHHWTRLTHADTASFGGLSAERAAGSGRLWRARALYLRDHVALGDQSRDELLRLAALASLCDACGEIDMASSCLSRVLAQRALLDDASRHALASHLRALERE